MKTGLDQVWITRLCSKTSPDRVRPGGRLTIAQRFIAGESMTSRCSP